MRIATFNAENMFSRPAAMNHPDNEVGQPVLDDYHRLNRLLKARVYTAVVKAEVEELVDRYKLMDRAAQHDQLILRVIRGKLWQQHQDGTRTWEAAGSADFLGWAELVRQAIDDRAIKNTARVLAEVSADIQLLIEIEDRVTLQRFHDDVLVHELDNRGLQPYRHILLMDGNDPRGIDVGLLSRVPVTGMKSHVELRNAGGDVLFPRDCAQFAFELGNGQSLVILGNHFSSQGSDRTGQRRTEQAKAVRRIVDEVLQTTRHVIVAGDLNEAPGRGNLSALLTHPDLLDAMAMDAYPEKETFPGTYRSGSQSNKLDYLLLSRSLQAAVQAVGVERRGYHSTKWQPFDTVVDERSQASDHHCVWVDVSL
jgi:endonuclease/exonuclease/phosphatase family metal-dependent hydrolase